MNFDNKVLDELTQRAKESPRLRMNLDLRNSPEDGSQRMLNALEPGTVLPIHRHRTTSEVVVMLRGRAVQEYYDDEGRVVASFELRSWGDARSESGMTEVESGMTEVESGVTEGEAMTEVVCAMSIPAGQWHKLVALESGTVIFEAKDGPYEPISPADILSV